MTQHNYKKTVNIIVLSIIVLAVCSCAVSAKEIIISNGISLSDTVENRTVIQKTVDATIGTESVKRSIETEIDTGTKTDYPVFTAISALDTAKEKAAYKAEYIAENTNLVGQHKVTISGKEVILNIESYKYDPTLELVQFNLTASVDGVSKEIRNPVKIKNPPVFVQTKHKIIERDIKNKTFVVKDPGEAVENPENAVLSSLALTALSVKDGDPTFYDGDPIIVIYETEATVYDSTFVDGFVDTLGFDASDGTSFLTAITSSGTANVGEGTHRVFIYIDDSPSIFVSRAPMSFDTSALTGYTIYSASIGIFSGEFNEFGTPVSNVNYSITGFNPSTPHYTASDYQTNLTQRVIQDVSMSEMPFYDFKTMDLNSYGISYINKTGQTNLMGRFNYDVDSIAIPYPTSPDIILEEFDYSNANETFYSPRLTMTYGFSGLPTDAGYSVNNKYPKVGQVVTFTPKASSTGGNYFNWSFGDGVWSNVSTTAAQSHAYSTMNVYEPTLYVYNVTDHAIANQTLEFKKFGVGCIVVPSFDEATIAASSSNPDGEYLSEIVNNGADTLKYSFSLDQELVSDDSVVNNYSYLTRGAHIFDTNGIPDYYTITNASLYLYGSNKHNDYSTAPSLVITNFTPTTAGTIVAGDYLKYGSSVLGSNTTYASFSSTGYNQIYLNSVGRSQIDIYGYTNIMSRLKWDVDVSAPTWGANYYALFSELPKDAAMLTPQYSYLLVNYTSPSNVSFTANTTVGIPGSASIGFTDTTVPPEGSWNWSFGDGSLSTEQNPVHTYAGTGYYTVRLESPTGSGLFFNRTNYINISSPSFYCTPTAGANPLITTCHDTSAIKTGSNRWIWGDTTSDDDSGDISHTYTSAGTYTVQMKSPIAGGATSTRTNYITSGVITPVAAFTSNVTEVAAGGYVAFTDTSTNTPTSWRWSFSGGTGSDSTSQNPTYQFNTVGNFSVNLTATNAAGSDSEVKTNYIRVYPAGWYSGMLPITAADFTVSPYQYTNVNNALTFTGTVTTGTAQYYKWDFNGATVIDNTTAVASHVYTTTGNKTVNFTAYNAISSYSVIKPEYIQVFGPGVPYANFYAQPTGGTPGVLINFVDQSLHGTSTGLVCNWSFGDSTYSTQAYSSICGDVGHVYTYAGIYDVNLSITNANGTSFLKRDQYITVATDQNYAVTYPPKDVRFHVQTLFGKAIPNTHVTAVASQTTTGDYAYTASLFGYQLDVVPLDTLTLSGYTDSKGDITFAMMSDTQYSMGFVATGYTFTNQTITPHDDNYIILANGDGGSPFITNGSSPQSHVTFTATYTRYNETAALLFINYTDSSFLTSGGQISLYRSNTSLGYTYNNVSEQENFISVSFTGSNTSNGYTLIDGTTAACPASSSAIFTSTGTLVSCTNQTLVNDKAYFAAATGMTPGGNVSVQAPVWFKNLHEQISGLSSEFGLFIALGIMMITALMATTSTAPAMSIVFAFEGWIFYGLNMLRLIDSPTAYGVSVVSAVLTVITGVAILFNFVDFRRKGK